MSAYSFSIESMIRGYHVYKNIWNDPLDDEELECKCEPGNSSDPYAVAVMESTQLLDQLEVFKYRYFLILKTADCSHMRTHIRTKIGESNFGKFMVIRQICQGFPPPIFPSIR